MWTSQCSLNRGLAASVTDHKAGNFPAPSNALSNADGGQIINMTNWPITFVYEVKKPLREAA